MRGDFNFAAYLVYQPDPRHAQPAFFNRDEHGIPRQWLQMVRRAMVTLVPQYNTWRMVQEYTRKYYLTGKPAK